LSKRHYETYIIVDGNLDDTAIEEVIKKYESLLTKNEAEIVKTERIGRRRLAYSIKGRQNGSYVAIEIISSPAVVTKLEKTFKLDENILRFLTIFVSARTIKEKEEHIKNKAIMQAKYDELREKQNSIAQENANGNLSGEKATVNSATEVLQNP